MKINEKNYVLLFTLIMLSIFFYGKYNHEVTETRKIKDEFKIANGIITEFTIRTARNTFSPTYKYRVKDEVYKSSFSNQYPCKKLSKSDKRRLKAFNFPVIYSVSEPDLSRILIRPKDFEKFDLVFPDSLSSVYQDYFKKCEDDWIHIRWW